MNTTGIQLLKELLSPLSYTGKRRNEKSATRSTFNFADTISEIFFALSDISPFLGSRRKRYLKSRNGSAPPG